MTQGRGGIAFPPAFAENTGGGTAPPLQVGDKVQKFKGRKFKGLRATVALTTISSVSSCPSRTQSLKAKAQSLMGGGGTPPLPRVSRGVVAKV